MFSSNNALKSCSSDLVQTIHEIQQKTQAPLALIILSVLSNLSSACQGMIDVKNPTGAKTPTDLYALNIAESSERKSTVDRLTSKPLLDYELRRKQENKRLLKDYEQEMFVWQVKYRKAKKCFQKAIESDDPNVELYQQELAELIENKPKKIQLCQTLFADTTIEALLYGMSGASPYATLTSSDASNILNKFNANWLSNINLLYDGDTIRVERKNSESFTIENGRLTLALMIQPKMLKQMLEKQNDSARHIGTLARMLVCYPESTQGHRFFQNPDLSENCGEYIEKYYARITEILEQSSSYQAYGHRVTLEFLPEAKQIWIQFYNHIESQLSWQGGLSDIRDAASKMANNVARIAALLHYYTYGTKQISLECTQAAIDLGYYYLEQFKHLFGEKTLQEQAFNNGSLLSQWLVKNHKYGTYVIPKKVLYSYGPNSLRNKDKLEMAVWYLHNTGKLVYYYNSKPACIHLTQQFLLENNLQ